MIPTHFMINSRKFGVPDQVCTLHSKILNNAKCYIKRALGSSTTSYSSTEKAIYIDKDKELYHRELVGHS